MRTYHSFNETPSWSYLLGHKFNPKFCNCLHKTCIYGKDIEYLNIEYIYFLI